LSLVVEEMGQRLEAVADRQKIIRTGSFDNAWTIEIITF